MTGYAGTIALVQQPAPPPDDPGGRGEDFGKSSPVGLVVLLVFVVAVILLVRSMNKHLKRVPESFDPPAAGPADTDTAAGAPDGSATGGGTGAGSGQVGAADRPGKGDAPG